MANKDSVYRLNCVLDASFGERLMAHCEKTKLSRTAIVSMALDQYFNQAELLDRLVTEVSSDPVKLAEVCKAFGITPQV